MHAPVARQDIVYRCLRSPREQVAVGSLRVVRRARYRRLWRVEHRTVQAGRSDAAGRARRE